ncbi:MAG TPA: hypothetical protein VFA33_18695 [Bryobacteraceae bacterium]|nr:hypothetical protein [Bryobacteraceae bacterium]
MLVVVGGHTRNIGKTAVAAGIIHALPEGNWTAIKITQLGHGICAARGKHCGCEADMDHPFSIREEVQPGRSDTGRYVAAGARRCYWVRTVAGQLRHAVPRLRGILSESENAIIESNSVMEYLQPDVFLMVLDFGCEDFKPSSQRFLHRAHAFIVIDNGIHAPRWKGVAPGGWDGKPRFVARPPQYVPADLAEFVKGRLEGAAQR